MLTAVMLTAVMLTEVMLTEVMLTEVMLTGSCIGMAHRYMPCIMYVEQTSCEGHCCLVDIQLTNICTL